MAVLVRLLDRDPHGVDAAHLAGADPDRLQVLGDHDRVRGDVLADAGSEEQVAPLGLGRLARRDLHPLAVLDVPVAVLDEQAAEHALVVALPRLGASALGVVEDPDRLLADERLERDLVVAGREQHLDELLRELLAERGADGAVEDDDAAVGGERVGCERDLVRLLDRRADGDAARVRVLDDHAGRERELAHEQPRRVEVVEVVERELAAVQLLDARQQVGADAALGVVGGALMRVLAVREVEVLLEDGREDRRERLASREPGRDRRLVRGRGRERGRRETPARLQRDHAGLAQLRQHGLVVLGPADRRHVGEVLRRAAQHRRPADVDHLDGLLLADAVLPRDLLERVQVDADEVEQLDPVLCERGQVGLDLASGEDAGVDVRMQRLHPAAEHLRELGQTLDRRHRQAELTDRVRRAAARDQLPVERGESLRERVEAGLVEHRDQRTHSSLTTSGSSRCSTARIRWISVSLGWTGTGSWRITGPVSRPSSTRWTVTPVVSTPAARASSIARAPGNSGSSEGWTLTIRSGKRSRNRPVSRCM